VADQDSRKVQAASFGAAAGVYERARPTYPAQAIDWLLPPGGRLGLIWNISTWFSTCV
jgi:hypothetical protein